MADRFEMRLEVGERDRWQEAAGQAALSSFVRACVEERIAGRLTQVEGIERMAARVGDRLEGLLDAHLHRLDQSLHSAQGQPVAATGLPPGYTPVGPPRPPTPTSTWIAPAAFDPHCDQAEFHRVGTVCPDCAGNGLTKGRAA